MTTGTGGCQCGKVRYALSGQPLRAPTARPAAATLAVASLMTLAGIAAPARQANAVTLEALNGAHIQATVMGTQKFVINGKPTDVAVVGSGLIRISGRHVQGSVTRTYRYGGQSGPENTSSISGDIVDSAPQKGRAWVFDGTTLSFHDVVEALHIAAVYRVMLGANGKSCIVRVTSAAVPGQTVTTSLLGFAGFPKTQLLSSTLASSECHVMR